MTTDPDPLLVAFMAARRLAGSRPATLRTYQTHLPHFFTWRAGRPIDRRLIRQYMAHLADTKSNPVTINGYLRDVSTFCSWLVEEGELEVNPALRLRVRTPRRRPASYGRDQVRALLAVADVRDYALVIVLLDTGLRVAELIQLRRDRIDMASGHFAIIGKGNKERSGWLSPYALRTVRAYLATRRDRDPALWLGRHDRPLGTKGVHQAIHRLAVAAGIRGQVRRLVHSFRATFARNWLKGGGDLGSLAGLLGHSSLAMSHYYSQLNDDELAERKRAVNPLAQDLEEAA